MQAFLLSPFALLSLAGNHSKQWRRPATLPPTSFPPIRFASSSVAAKMMLQNFAGGRPGAARDPTIDTNVPTGAPNSPLTLSRSSLLTPLKVQNAAGLYMKVIVTRENKIPEPPRRTVVDDSYVQMVLDKREQQLRLTPEALGATCDL